MTGASLRLQDVARLFGVNARTILRLEEAGKIGKVPRMQSGQRRFTAENLRAIQAHCPKAARNLEETGAEILVVPPKQAAALTIGEVAAQFGTHPRTLQRLEREGKIGPIARDHAGRRKYRPSDIKQIRKIFFGGKVVNPPWIEGKAKSS